MAERCPICGEQTLVRRRGRFTFRWPEGFARRTSGFRGAEWDHCLSCGEEILPPRLLRRIEAYRTVAKGTRTTAHRATPRSQG